MPLQVFDFQADELPDEFAHALRPPEWIFSKHVVYQVSDSQWYMGHKSSELWWGLLSMCFDEPCCGLGFKGPATCEAFKQGGSQTINVASLVSCKSGGKAFGRDVMERTREGLFNR